MQYGMLPPTINLDTPDPECDLDYVPHHARPLTPQTCLINAFAYGGLNSFLLLRKG
jgi:3-oxoacyl-[acyl-carrier-protein] synthase II